MRRCQYLLSAVVFFCTLLGTANADVSGSPTGICNYRDGRGWVQCGNYPRVQTRVDTGPSPEELRQAAIQKDVSEATQWEWDKGIDAYKHGDYAAAIKRFKEALSYSPDSTELKHNLLRAQQALQLQQADGQNDAGIAAYNRGDYSSALSAFSQASSIAPDVDIYRRNADRARAMIAYRNELLAQRDKIDARIHGYQEAIKRLGFGENVAEIEEWTALSKDAKKQFEEKSAALAADLIVSKFQDEAMHHAFHDLDPQRAKRLIALMDKHDPRPIPLMRLVAILGHMNAGDRDTIERAAKGLTAEIQGLIEHGDATWSKAEILKLAIDIGDGVFGTSYAKLWSVTDVSLASLYNNATRRMAMAEIDRITTLNQRQMSTLKYLHAKLVADVKERQRINGELQAR